jgi:DNA modification methylase
MPAPPDSTVPDCVRGVLASRRGVPEMAKDPARMAAVAAAVAALPTNHRLVLGDARSMGLPPASVDLVVTSPPYWNLKRYNPSAGQMGDVEDYGEFLRGLDRVWAGCYDALVPGGRVACVVGDVCRSRRQNGGRHAVVPLHAAIQERCRGMGFDNLAGVIWHKIANARTESSGNGSPFLGKPYEPNAVIKNDIEYVLMLRKPGGYRSPGAAARALSVIPAGLHARWFRQIWSDVPGASTRGGHPAPFPLEIASRLVRMFSFVGDTVLDPFAGSGTVAVAASACGRDSVGYEIDPAYLAAAALRLEKFRGGRDGIVRDSGPNPPSATPD